MTESSSSHCGISPKRGVFMLRACGVAALALAVGLLVCLGKAGKQQGPAQTRWSADRQMLADARTVVAALGYLLDYGPSPVLPANPSTDGMSNPWIIPGDSPRLSGALSNQANLAREAVTNSSVRG